jgi:hypothetical protein
MNSDKNFALPERLDLTKAKLLKVIDYGLDLKLLEYAHNRYPWYIKPTKRGLEFAGISSEKEASHE